MKSQMAASETWRVNDSRLDWVYCTSSRCPRLFRISELTMKHRNRRPLLPVCRDVDAGTLTPSKLYTTSQISPTSCTAIESFTSRCQIEPRLSSVRYVYPSQSIAEAILPHPEQQNAISKPTIPQHQPRVSTELT